MIMSIVLHNIEAYIHNDVTSVVARIQTLHGGNVGLYDTKFIDKNICNSIGQISLAINSMIHAILYVYICTL